ncbi:hypothetical protein VZT92_006485 [Zoarces viviparus]|uniref:Uncharacterized protein n=1 Tax=Zoarces viviparus TaxID=48416 RepID=A0AAW1FPK9_ZOAVI
MLVSPDWCYSKTNGKDHFHEKVPDAVFHPTLPTPFKEEEEQQQQQLQKYTGRGSAGFSQGSSTEKPIDCIHRDYLPCCIHGCLVVGGGGVGGGRGGGEAQPSHHPFMVYEKPSS